MNERIKLLATQAGFQSYITTHEEDVAMFEKFAELIVKECCNFNYDFLESYREACEVNGKIREHFGVEE